MRPILFITFLIVSAAFGQKKTPLLQADFTTKNYLQLPLAFEKRSLGSKHDVFVARGEKYVIGVEHAKATIALQRSSDARPRTISLEFLGAKASHAETGAPLQGKVNYIRGKNPAAWEIGLGTFSRITYRSLYSGIDLVYYGNQRQLEFDLVVKPGADPRNIRMQIAGGGKLSIDAGGSLQVSDSDGDLTVALPAIYQNLAGKRQAVAGRFAIRNNHEVAFIIDNYDKTRALVIDPTIVYSTILSDGNSSAYGAAIALDNTGNIYVTGSTSGVNFPVVNAYQGALKAGFDAFVSKISSDGTTLLYSTFIGGSQGDNFNAITVDSTGAAWLIGQSQSADFPTLNAQQSTKSGYEAAVVVKLSSVGALAFSTFAGVSGYDSGSGIAVDSSDRAYATGSFSGTYFPTTSGAIATTITGSGGAFVMKFDSAGNLLYSTILGGDVAESGQAIAADNAGNAYVTGVSYSSSVVGQPTGGAQTKNAGGGDAYVAKLNASGTALSYFTFVGGSGSDVGYSIAVDAAGSAYVAGQTASAGLATSGSFQTSIADGTHNFVAKLNPTGTAFGYLTYIGGSKSDLLRSLAIDTSGNAYLAGYTKSPDFPLVSPIQPSVDANLVSLSRTTNTGASWAAFEQNIPGVVVGLSVNSTNSNSIAALTDSGLYRSSNGGSSWSKQLDVSFYTGNSLTRSPATPGTLYILFGSWIYRSIDDGLTWNYMGSMPQQGYAILADPLTANTAYASTYTSVYKTTDGGTTWATASTGLPSNSPIGNLVATSDGSLYVGFLASTGIYKSGNHAGSWSSVNNGIGSASTAFPNSLAASGNTVYLANGSLYKTTDGGASWTTIPNSAYPYAIAVSPRDASVIYAITSDSKLVVSTDSGFSWSSPGTGLPKSLSFFDSSIIVDPTTTGRAYIISPSAYVGFVQKLNPIGTALLWSTFLGGSSYSAVYGIATNASGDVYATGVSGQGFPVTPLSFPGRQSGAFVTRISDSTAACSTLTVSPTTSIYSSAYHTVTLSVLAPSGCAWTASTDQAWASTTGTTAGTATGTLKLALSNNGTSGPRTATITVGSTTAIVTQAGPGCIFSFDKSSYNSPSAGGSVTVKLYTGSNCPWSVTNNYGNVSITSGASGTGSGSIVLVFPPNFSTPDRSFTFNVADSTFSVVLSTPVVTVASTTLPFGAPSVPYSAALSASGGTPPYQNWKLGAGALPTGVTLDKATGIVSGTPGSAVRGTFTFTVTATDSVGTVSSPAQLSLKIAAPITFTLSASANPVIFGKPLTLTATVSTNTANGTVIFYDGLNILGYGTVNAGIATLTTNLLAAGRHSLKASYSGNNLPATSAPLQLTVNTSPANNFAAPLTNSVAGYTLVALAHGDFNRDGKQDFLVSSNSGTQVFLGNGDGTFQVLTLSPGASWGPIAVGDFNGDGKPDLFAAGAYSADTFLGNGDGTFQSQKSSLSGIPTSYRTGSAIVGDFNGDGKLDVAISAVIFDSTYTGIIYPGVVSIMLGNGDGTFQTGVTYAAGSGTNSVISGDFNGDGITDLVVANANAGLSSGSLLLGNGDGTFKSPIALSLGGSTNPSGVVAGDFNGDGKLDLAFANQGYANQPEANPTGDVVVLSGNGDGTFAAPVHLAAGSSPRGIAVGDINGDGKLDIVIAASLQNAAGLLLGNGDGTFQSPVYYTTGNYPRLLLVGDFNGDGLADLAALNYNLNAATDVSATVGVLLGRNQAPGSYATATALRSTLGTAGADVPLRLTASVSPSSATGSVTYYDGTVRLGVATIAAGQAALVTSALSVGTHSLTAVYGGDSTWKSSTSPVYTQTIVKNSGGITLTASPNPSSVGQNVLLRATVLPPTATGYVTFYDDFSPLGSVILSAGTAAFIVDSFSAGNHPLWVQYFGDTDNSVNNTQRMAFTVFQAWASTTTTLNSSAAFSLLGKAVTFTATVTPNTATGKVTFYDGTTILGVAPLAAGKASLVTSTLSTGVRSLVALFQGDGIRASSKSGPLALTVQSTAGTGFQPAVNYSTGAGPYYGTSADFNRDGKLDLAISNQNSNTVSILLGNGDGTFKPAVAVSVDTSPRGIAAGDFNGDGLVDLLVVNWSSQTIGILLGNGDGTFQTPTKYYGLFTNGFGPNSLTLADFNGDGIMDFAIVTSNGEVKIYNVPTLPYLSYGTALTYNAAFSIASGDFNRDGIPDLAIVGDNSFSIQFGNGDGTFQQAVKIAPTGSPHSIVVADIDGDGLLDVAFADGSAVVYLGNGDGTFKPALYSTGATNAYGIAAGDFNGDGKLDLVLTGFESATNAGNANILFGKGDGTFQPPVSYPVGQQPYAVLTGDFNGDGRADLALPNSTDGNVSILLANIPTQTIVFPVIANQNLNTGRLAISATSNFGLPVTFTSSTAPVCSVSGSVVTFVSDGTCTLTASQPGNSTYSAAPPVTQSFLIFANPIALLGVTMSHVGNFAQSQVGATYTVLVSNSGTASTFGIVAATFTAPAGLTVTSRAGNGWYCAITCSRGDTLAAGATYPAITITVTVDPNASSLLTGNVIVTGGSSVSTSANDPTTIATALTDTTPADYFFPAVNLLREYGITSGCGGTNYCPNDNVTRWQMAIFIVRTVLGGDNFTYSPTPYFSDVPSTASGFKWVQKMYELGITAGCGGGLYCPNDSVTRGTMAIFVIRARLGTAADSSFTYPATPSFTDVPTSAFYYKWVQRMKVDQITGGCSATEYCPDSPVTRGQMAIFLMRAGFNRLLPATTTLVLSASPAVTPLGVLTTVKLTASNTNFVQGTTQVQAGPGITVGTVTVIDSLNLSVQLTVAADAATGKRTLVVNTGAEQAILPNGIAVQ